MSNYYASLTPENSVESVFNDLFTQTAEVTDRVRQLHEGEHGPLDRPGIGFSLSGLDLSIGITPGFLAHNMPIETVRIFAYDAKEHYPLISVASDIQSSRGENRFGIPLKVEAYRDAEKSCGDYSIAKQGKIIARLARLGISGAETIIPDEPYGKTMASPSTPIGELPETDYARLAIVSQGIVEGISAVRVLLAGAAAKDVLTLQGRHLDRSGYVHPYSAEAVKPEMLQERKYPLTNTVQIAAAA